MSIQDTGAPYGTRDFIDGLNNAIRENPLAAGLIGAGLAWMLFRKSAGAAIGSRLPGAVKGVANAAVSAAGKGTNAVSDGVSAVAGTIAETTRTLAGSVSESAQSAVETASEGAGKLAATAGNALQGAAEWSSQGLHESVDWATEQGTSLRQRLSRHLEAQPILIGAIGLAIGAGIASAFPKTDREDRLMGEAGSAARSKLQELSSSTREVITRKAGQILGEVKSAAAEQGLTSDVLATAAGAIEKKVEHVAGTARSSVESRLSGIS